MNLLPVVAELRDNIDQVYTQFAGPFGAIVAEEEFEYWLNNSSGRPGALLKYIERLANTLDSTEQQQEFKQLAHKALRT